MRIVFAASEASPFAKTCGMADAVSHLAAAVARLGHNVSIFLPYHRKFVEQAFDQDPTLRRVEATGKTVAVQLADRLVTAELFTTSIANGQVPVILIDQPEFYARPSLYRAAGRDYHDNCESYCFFSRAVFEAIGALGIDPDVIHAHDWQTALIPAFAATTHRQRPGRERIATVFTIHNIAFQGQFPPESMTFTGIDRNHYNWQEMEAYGHLNLLKSGIVFCDLVTTVSPGHAIELRQPEFGFGLDGALKSRGDALSGILLGVDTTIWNPECDPHIAHSYSAENWRELKPLCKKDLQERFGLPVRPDVPMLGMITRLVAQKGFDILLEGAKRILAHDLQIVVLGTGEICYETALSELCRQHPEKIATRTFEETLAHRVEAGSDIYLMPSRYEPCGLHQLYGMLYGTVPVVSATGGLASSVVPVSDATLKDRTATGFLISEHTPEALAREIERAITLYRQPDLWAQLVESGLAQDWSWHRAATEYSALYEKAVRSRDAHHPAVTSFSARTAEFQVLDAIVVKNDRETARIELCVGDVTRMPVDQRVDALVVSAFPNDYHPLAGSLMGALDAAGVSIRRLSQAPARDLRTDFSCWLSRPLKESESRTFQRILCFEPLRKGSAPEQVGDLFRAIAAVAFDDPPIRSVATPILASGYQRQSPVIMLEALVERAREYLKRGFPISVLRIVAHPPDYLMEAERAHYMERIISTFRDLRRMTPTHSTAVARDRAIYEYDLFVSYARPDGPEAGLLVESVRSAMPEARIFLDTRSISRGESWQHTVYSSLDDCWKMIALYSPSYLRSKPCIEELNIGLCRSRNEERPVVYPIYLATAKLPTYMELVNYMDCRECNREKLAAAGRDLVLEMMSSR